jgi:hypothetical protein
MAEPLQVGDRVKVYFDAKFGENEGWHEGTVFKIDPYSDHRSFYWVELNPDVQILLGIMQISVFNPRNIQKI